MTLPPAAHPDARLLVVDDEPGNLHLLSRILASAGYRSVETTADPRTVAARVAERATDLLLLDLHMPHLDGFGVLEQLAALPTTRMPPVLVLTGDTTPEARRRAFQGGARDIITKPFEPDEALLRVGNVLDAHFLQRRLRAQNHQLEQQLQHADRLEVIGRLTSGIAHDFNNLLTVSRGNAEMARQQLSRNTPAHDDLGHALHALDAAGALARRLLGFSRINAVQPQRVELNAAVRDALQLSGRLIGQAIRVEAELSAGPLHVMADPRQIDQVGDEPGRQRARRHACGGNAAGEHQQPRGAARGGRRGIPDPAGAVRGHHHRRHRRRHRSRRPRAHLRPVLHHQAEGKGTGLGLSIVYGIVKQASGYIWVESEPGRGTLFTLYLPTTAEAAGGAPAA